MEFHVIQLNFIFIDCKRTCLRLCNLLDWKWLSSTDSLFWLGETKSLREINDGHIFKHRCITYEYEYDYVEIHFCYWKWRLRSVEQFPMGWSKQQAIFYALSRINTQNKIPIIKTIKTIFPWFDARSRDAFSRYTHFNYKKNRLFQNLKNWDNSAKFQIVMPTAS